MITKTDALTAKEFHREGLCTRIIGPRGGVVESSCVWRRNGVTQTWKSLDRLHEFRVPVKWGLKIYSQITHDETSMFHIVADCPLNDPKWVSTP